MKQVHLLNFVQNFQFHDAVMTLIDLYTTLTNDIAFSPIQNFIHKM